MPPRPPVPVTVEAQNDAEPTIGRVENSPAAMADGIPMAATRTAASITRGVIFMGFSIGFGLPARPALFGGRVTAPAYAEPCRCLSRLTHWVIRTRAL